MAKSEDFFIPPLTIDAAVAFLDRRYALTPRQREVARLVLLGWTDRQIAQELGIAVNTVRDHLRKLFERLDIASRSEVVGCLFRDDRSPNPGAIDERTQRSGGE